ncbi:MAG TPA: UdgX family uracil-DNA binding protein [Acidimicrobiales bacterium]|nr:UdgX family uracil-DNA binding protein [Acidimicrobiales bacterium]
MDPARALEEARAAASTCTACDLYRRATQTVFGEGRVGARLTLVGEQPGDREDVVGRPFVGPAGAVLDRALEAAGIDRSDVYLTNAVKHFRFEVVGKRRIHQKPNTTQVVACRPWLVTELDLVNPSTVVCLGVTAARAVFGRPVTIGKTRGREHVVDGRRVVVTVHPSSLLRQTDDAERDRAMQAFVDDLRLAARRQAA